jgi:chromosome segregation ATPase
MEETLSAIQNDSTLMLIGGIAIAVLLAIVLVVVVSAMRVKVYKDRFKNLLFENKEKAEHITKIEKELQEYKIKDAKNQQELAQFDETKSTLKTANESYLDLQSRFNENEKELSQIKAKLEAKEGMYEALVKEHESLKERFDTTLEENTKHRTTNARLLMKLENEERFAQTMREKKEAQGKA